jgi:gluconolactonase
VSATALRIAVSELGRWGRDLSRPENVLAFRDGTVFASSNQGHITRIAPDRRQWQFGNLPGGQPTTMALESQRALLVNNTADGCIYRLSLDGRHELVLDSIEGHPIGSANHVFRDGRGRIWIAVATRRQPPHEIIHVVPDGYIALLEGTTARIVADGLHWPNEVRLDADERYAYVSETFAGRILRYPVDGGGALGEPETVGPQTLGAGAFPDGFALDVEGNVWVAVVSRNALMIIGCDGTAQTVFEQPVDAAVRQIAEDHASGRIPRASLAACAGPDLRLLTSVGFAGPELRNVVMGSLAMTELVSFESPVSGLALQHQHVLNAPAQPAIICPE